MRENPVELFAVTEGILDEMYVVTDPDTFLLDKVTAECVFLQKGTIEVGTEADIAKRLRFILEPED